MSWEGIKIGALWQGRGKAMFTGRFGDARVVVMPNNNKKTDKHPDAIVYIVPDDRKPEGGGDEGESW
jgi:hypothetical protein